MRTIGTRLLSAFSATLLLVLALLGLNFALLRQSARQLDSVLHIYHQKLDAGSQVELATTEMQGAQRGLMLSRGLP